ncbi:YihY/virulence factor BrkB family protein [Rhizobacter sp. LjRoot28]|uniref:YihY/virulence factor BrkB family protein n=1 Tax=Rhizobacter sp. LjRoot28 TaxID=3342309 RepID=UPI003ECFEAE5
MPDAALAPPRARNAWELLRHTVSSWSDDYAPSMGAAIAYYTMFSIAPLLLIVVSVAGLVFGEEAARGEIFGQLETLIGAQGASAVQSLLQSTNKPAESGIATLVGVVALLIGATTVFAELQTSLDRIWRAPTQGATGIFALLRSRLLSFGLILGLGFLLMVSLLVSAALSALENWWAPAFGEWALTAQVANFVFSMAFITAVFAMIYKFMPRVHVGWSDVWVGAIVTSLLFSIGKLLIGIYIGRSSVTSAFGAAGSLAVLLVWVYYSAQIFLMGAEFTWVYAHSFGSRKGVTRPTGQAPR